MYEGRIVMKKSILGICSVSLIAVMLFSSIGVASADERQIGLKRGSGTWSYGWTYLYNVWSQYDNNVYAHAAGVKIGRNPWKSTGPISKGSTAYISDTGFWVNKVCSLERVKIIVKKGLPHFGGTTFFIKKWRC